MHPLETDTLTLCRRHALLTPGERLVVGVSGGPDSMALLQVLHRLRSELGVVISVAHVDHGLRPAAAKDEEALVRTAATNLGLDCLVAHRHAAAHAKAHGLSLEEAARELRYAFFDEVAAAQQATKIAVAHTADDQAEEVLLRLIRGAGRKGLAGMPLVREGRIVRPFLGIAKARLLAYLGDKGQAFAIDDSNLDRRYLRNRIRHDLIPYLTEFNKNIKTTLLQTAAILADEDAFIEDQVAHDYALVVSSTVHGGNPLLTVDCRLLHARHLSLRRRLLERVLISLGNKPSFRQIDSLLSLAAATGNGGLHLKDGLRVSKEAGVMTFCYPHGKQPWRGEERTALPFCHQIPGLGRYPIPELDQEVEVELLTTVPSLAAIRHQRADFLDLDGLSFPLLLRSRAPGDRFHPLNAPGQRKVADFLTDCRWPRSARDRLPLLVSNSHIVALLGCRVSHQNRVTEASRAVLKVTLRPA